MIKKILIFLLLSSNAMADVVFIDLNNVEQEIAVARQAAKARGEKLIVLPLERSKYRNPARVKVLKQITMATEKIEKTCETSSPANCQKAHEEIRRLEEELEKIPANFYDAQTLREELNSVKDNVSSIMISGHDGDGDFHGEFGDIMGGDFQSILKEYPGRDNIKSLYLLGCHSATTHTLADLWKKALPKAHFIAGYDGIGYLRDNGLGHDFIKKLMAEEQNIVSSASMAQALKKFRDISPKSKDHNTGASVILNCNYSNPILLSSTAPAISVAELHQCPKDLRERAEKFLKCALTDKPTCALNPEAQEITRELSKPGSCNFLLQGDYDASVKMLNAIYLLSFMSQKGSNLNPEMVFSKAPEKIRKKFNINPSDIKTYPEMKEKLLALRNHYDGRFNFSSIKDMSMPELTARANEKKYFDRAWLAFSNLDVLSAHRLSQRSEEGSGGVIRAQAFYKAFKAGEKVGTFKERIESLEKQKVNYPAQESTDTMRNSDIIRSLDKEIAFLKQYETEKF